jgi:hypothetical protein
MAMAASILAHVLIFWGALSLLEKEKRPVGPSTSTPLDLQIVYSQPIKPAPPAIPEPKKEPTPPPTQLKKAEKRETSAPSKEESPLFDAGRYALRFGFSQGNSLKSPGLSSKRQTGGAGTLNLEPSPGQLLSALSGVGPKGPRSDAKRAEERTRGYLQGMLARADVQNGMADDYHRLLGQTLKRQWRPHGKELNRGGEEASRNRILLDFITNPTRWKEFFDLYVKEAFAIREGMRNPDFRHEVTTSADTVMGQQIARLNAELPTEFDEDERGGPRRQAFRYVVQARIKIQHDGHGEVQAVEILHSSGHPEIDRGIREAVKRSDVVFDVQTPARVADGGPFENTWLFKATWQVVPPICMGDLLSSAQNPTARSLEVGCVKQFDITSKGIEVEMPFDVKLLTEVNLIESQPVRQ